MSISSEITKFYRTFAPKNAIGHCDPAKKHLDQAKISPIPRLHFGAAVGIAILNLIQKFALSIFSLFGVLVTCGMHKNLRASLSENVKQSLVYAGAIPIGYLGLLFPQWINQNVAKIPPGGIPLRTQVRPLKLGLVCDYVHFH